ncbi:MAG TPA: alpha/beta hydrolase, partial [Rubellimicrobium sp.]|nr:alpha/beta hydrolase [Rubellimicrobium sp.]
MHSLLKSTTAKAALAAALSLSPLPLLAQEASTGGTAATGAATGAATDTTTTAQDTTAAQGTDTGATELAQDDPLTGDAGTTVAQDDALTGDPDTTVAQDDATTATSTDATTTAQDTTGTAATDGTATAQGSTGTAATDGTATAQDATGAAATDTTQTAQDATGDAAADGTQTTQDATATGDVATDTAVAQEGTDAATDTAGTQDTQTAAGDVPAEPGAEMAAVLDKHAELGAQPIESLSVEDARTQPTPADAVMAVMEEQGIEMPAELAAIATRDVTYPAADGSEQAARVYPPEGEGPVPLLVYYHGGGWVIADIDTYDASARALSAGADAVVVSVEYRH